MNNAPLRYCVIGYPIVHSLSAPMQTAAFKSCGIAASYEAKEVPPGKLPEFMSTYREDFSGGNVTIPHKQAVMDFLDEVDATAQAIGAVNTIVNKSGKLIGYNTDWIGGLRALGISPGNSSALKGKTVLILGAGGAAHALVYSCLYVGAQVYVANRTFPKAQEVVVTLKKDIREKAVVALELDKITRCAPNIVINATSVGMGELDISLVPPNIWQQWQSGRAFDIVYIPRMTKFLLDAQRAGWGIVMGDGMFLHQGAEAFNMWTQLPPPIEVMRQQLEESLRLA